MKYQLLLISALLLATFTSAQRRVFQVGSGKDELNTGTLYTEARGYGWDDTTGLHMVTRERIKNSRVREFITADRPFSFSVALPEGEYDVRVFTGDKEGTSATTIRAECRRLMIYNQKTREGQVIANSFTVHVRDWLIRKNGKVTGKVKLKSNEGGYLHWDNRLTLEFSDSMPKVCEISITPAEVDHVIFLAGNSTVVDQAREPWSSWGQILPAFIDGGKIAIANYAESGEALHTFRAAGRLDKIFSQMHPGDFLLIEFGHNDQKRKGNNVGPFTSFKKELEYYVTETRKREATPILVTPVNRRTFDEQGKITNSLGDYPAAVRQVAAQLHVGLIDLNAMTKTLYESWGPEKSLRAFVHYPAGTFPGQTEALKDNTHFSPLGAWEIARCVVRELKRVNIPAHLRPLAVKKINLEKPMEPDAFYWPAAGMGNAVKPDGN